MPWQGIELESLPQLDAPCTCASSAPGLSLEFRCQQVRLGMVVGVPSRSLQWFMAQ